MKRAERRRLEREARKHAVKGQGEEATQRLDIAAIKRQLQQQSSPEKVHQVIANLVAQGLPLEAGEELAVYAAEYHDATALLQVEDDATVRVAALVNNAHDWADSMINQSPEVNRRACQAGCAFCCYVPTVLVTAAEAVYLVDWLRAHCATDELHALRQRLADRQRQTRTATQPSLQPPIPCPLLQNNQCMAYAARPLKCRGWNSLRRDVCEQAYGHSQSSVQIPADAYAFMMGNAVLSGLSDSVTHYGLDGRTYDLTEALLQIWEQPDATQRWWDEEPLFGKGSRPER